MATCKINYTAKFFQKKGNESNEDVTIKQIQAILQQTDLTNVYYFLNQCGPEFSPQFIFQAS